MITEKNLQEAIAYYNGKLDPEPNDAVMLAACYMLRDRMFPQEQQQAQAYSLAPEPPEIQYRYSGVSSEAVGDYGDSDFLQAVRGKNPAEMWPVMDDLMDTLRLAKPRLYDRIMREIG